MKYFLVGLVAIVSLVFLLGCTTQTTGSNDVNSQQLVGNDKDAFGCIPSAGYSWCDVKQKCIRVWEEDCNQAPVAPVSQIANTASTKCVENEGTLQIIDVNGGQVGMCTFPNGKVCEEWAYFRGDCNIW